MGASEILCCLWEHPSRGHACSQVPKFLAPNKNHSQDGQTFQAEPHSDMQPYDNKHFQSCLLPLVSASCRYMITLCVPKAISSSDNGEVSGSSFLFIFS